MVYFIQGLQYHMLDVVKINHPTQLFINRASL
jgi:hypothetical protein